MEVPVSKILMDLYVPVLWVTQVCCVKKLMKLTVKSILVLMVVHVLILQTAFSAFAGRAQVEAAVRMLIIVPQTRANTVAPVLNSMITLHVYVLRDSLELTASTITTNALSTLVPTEQHVTIFLTDISVTVRQGSLDRTATLWILASLHHVSMVPRANLLKRTSSATALMGTGVTGAT